MNIPKGFIYFSYFVYRLNLMTSQQELGKNLENKALQKIAISKSVDNQKNSAPLFF